MSKISKNIKKLRVSREMTQEELATKIHVTRQTVSSWETDRTQPDLEILLALAEAFEVQVEELIYGKRKNAAEEKEKLLFSSTLVTVLSVLGCLLIGAGVVMIFMKYWYDFPNALKIFTCFVPALLGQGTGIYTYIRKKESLAWCEGASVLWMLGTGVTTTVLLSQTNTNYIDEGIVYFFLAVCFFVLMLLFKSLSPLAVVYGFSLVSFVSALENSDYYYIRQGSSAADIARFIIATVVEGVLIALAVFVSKKFFKKENNIILYHFSEWINFVAVVVYACIALGRLNIEGAFYSVIILTVLICFIFGHKQESFASPCKLVGTLGTAAALCFLTIITEPIGFYGEIWVNVIVTAVGFVPFFLLFNGKTRPQNRYLWFYTLFLSISLCLFNIGSFVDGLRWHNRYDEQLLDEAVVVADNTMEAIFVLSFPFALAALVMLVIYGAKERKLLYLNLGFILSCVSVIWKLYLLDLGLIVTGLLLIVCGAGLLFINLKIAKIREKEKLASLNEGEGELQ